MAERRVYGDDVELPAGETSGRQPGERRTERMDLLSERLKHSRFTGDVELLDSIRSDEILSRHLGDADAIRYQNSIRMRLLAHAVRVDARLIRGLAGSIESLRERTGIDVPMETYVYQDPSVNGFVTRGQDHIFVALSSGAVNILSEEELEFVIGHELGHAVFGHLEVAAGYALQSGGLAPRSCMQLTAWQRASEISADRAGLICCDSLDTAATALFKTLSGLNVDGLYVRPAEFTKQWEHLEREVMEGGEVDHWHLSHPFPPLRMKAMMVFWESGLAQEAPAGATAAASGEAVDSEVRRLLAMMDPLARESGGSADPVLADFFLWGGIYLALANDELCDSELQQLATITSRARLDQVMQGGLPDPGHCLEQFSSCIERRHRRLQALEIHRIIEGLLHVAMADGQIDRRETEALETLAGQLGVGASACELMISEFQQGR